MGANTDAPALPECLPSPRQGSEFTAMDVIQGFNRQTRWLAVGLLSFTTFAALAVGLEEFLPQVADYASDESHSMAYTPGDAISRTLWNALTSNRKSSTDGPIFQEAEPLAIPTSPMNSPRQNPTRQMKIAQPTHNPSPVQTFQAELANAAQSTSWMSIIVPGEKSGKFFPRLDSQLIPDLQIRKQPY